jgi:hypothetical protein
MRTHSTPFLLVVTRPLLILLVIAASAFTVHAKVYIDIDSPGFRRLPLAVLSLDAGPGGAPGPDPAL